MITLLFLAAAVVGAVCYLASAWAGTRCCDRHPIYREPCSRRHGHAGEHRNDRGETWLISRG